MKILIIEDENLAADHLIKQISDLEPSCEIIGKLESVRLSVKWFTTNPLPDLIFMDVQLADGVCFEIFDKVKIETPVIFTTAYNEYALKAFKVNSIDYLLKPIDTNELHEALLKFKRLSNPNKPPEVHFDPLVFKKVMDSINKSYRQRYVVRIGEHIRTINCSDIAMFLYTDKSTFIRTAQGRDFGIDATLEQLETETNPAEFFRVNRKQIIAIHYIKDIIAYSGSRLKIVVLGNETDEIIVSREKVSEFKVWLEGK